MGTDEMAFKGPPPRAEVPSTHPHSLFMHPHPLFLPPTPAKFSVPPSAPNSPRIPSYSSQLEPSVILGSGGEPIVMC